MDSLPAVNISVNHCRNRDKKPVSSVKAALIGGGALAGGKLAYDTFQICSAARGVYKDGSLGQISYKKALSEAWNMFKQFGNVKHDACGGLKSKGTEEMLKSSSIGLKRAALFAGAAALIGAAAGFIINKIASADKQND